MTAVRLGLVGLGLAAAFLVGTRFGAQQPQSVPMESAGVATSAPRALATPAAATLNPQVYAQLVGDIVRAELDLRLAPPQEPGDEAPEQEPSTDPDDLAAVRSGAETVIAEAIEAGRWSSEDSEAVRVAAAQLSGPDIIEVHRVLMEAIVAGELVVDYDGPLF